MQPSQVAQWYRIHLPVQKMQETRVQSLGQEDPLEKETITHSSILAWTIQLTEEPGRIPSMGSSVHGVAKNWTTHLVQSMRLRTIIG